MAIIQAYTGWDDRGNRNLYNEFEIVSHDEIVEIAKEHQLYTVDLDCEQPTSDVWNYDYFKYDETDDDGTTYTNYIALRAFNYDEEVSKLHAKNAKILEDQYGFDYLDMLAALTGLGEAGDFYFETKDWAYISANISDASLFSYLKPTKDTTRADLIDIFKTCLKADAEQASNLYSRLLFQQVLVKLLAK